jgi:hypothetical protein
MASFSKVSYQNQGPDFHVGRSWSRTRMDESSAPLLWQSTIRICPVAHLTTYRIVQLVKNTKIQKVLLCTLFYRHPNCRPSKRRHPNCGHKNVASTYHPALPNLAWLT